MRPVSLVGGEDGGRERERERGGGGTEKPFERRRAERLCVRRGKGLIPSMDHLHNDPSLSVQLCVVVRSVSTVWYFCTPRGWLTA